MKAPGRFIPAVRRLPAAVLRIAGAASGLAWLAPRTAFAAGPQGDGAFTGSYAASLLKVLLVLALMIALIVWLLRFLAKKNRAWMSRGGFQPLAGMGLGPNRSVQIVKLGDALYVIGVGQDVRLLEKISDPDEVARITRSLEDSSSVKFSLDGAAGWLKRLRSQNGDFREERDTERGEFQTIFRDKLRQVMQRGDAGEREQDNPQDPAEDSERRNGREGM